MPTRRTILASVAVAGLGALVLSGKSDDLLRAAGIDPVPEVRATDQEFVSNAIAENQMLLAVATTLNATFAHKILVQQIIDLGGNAQENANENPPETLAAFQTELLATSKRRRKDALDATSMQLAQTLASLGAGLAQLGNLERQEL